MKQVKMEDHSKIVCYKRRKRHLNVGPNTQTTINGPRIVTCWSLSENDPSESTSRFPKIQQRSSKMRLRGQMSTIVEESYSMFNGQKNERRHKHYIKTLKLGSSSCTISNVSTDENSDAAATSQDIESLTLGSNSNKQHLQGRSHTAPNIKEAEPPSKFRKKRRKRAVKRSLSNSDVYTNYTVCPMQIELPKMKGSVVSSEKPKHHHKKRAPKATITEVLEPAERKHKESKDNADEVDGEKKHRHSKTKKDKDKASKHKEKVHHKHSEEAQDLKSKENVEKKAMFICKKTPYELAKRNSMRRLGDKDDSSFNNLCFGVIKKATIKRSELGSLEIPAFKKKSDNENRGLMLYNANQKNVLPSTDLIIHPNLIFAGILHKDTGHSSTNSLFGSSRQSILGLAQSSWRSTYDSYDTHMSINKPSDSFYDLNKNSLALLSELSSASGIQPIKSDDQCNFTPDLQKALNEVNEPSVKDVLEGLYDKPILDYQTLCNPYCYISMKNGANRGTNTDISWTQLTTADKKPECSKIPKLKREKSESRSRIPRYRPIRPEYRNITCATLTQLTVPEEKEGETFGKSLNSEVANLEEELFEFTFSEPSISDAEKTNKPDTIMKSETVLVNFGENKLDAKQSNVSIISIKENVVVTKKEKVTESTHSVSIQVYVPPSQVDAVTSITAIDAKSRSKLPVPVATIKSKQSMPSHTIPIEIDLKRASEGNVKADQASAHSCDNGQNVTSRGIFSFKRKKKSRKRPKLKLTEYQNLYSFYDTELVSLPVSAISMFPSFKSVFVDDASFEIESISFIGIDTNEIIMRAMEFAQPLHPNLEEDISTGKIKVANDDDVPLNLPITTTATGLSYYTFRSILRKYLAHRDTLQMLTPIVRGHIQKAPKVDSALLIDPVPVLEKISSLEFKLEDQPDQRASLVAPEYLEQGFDDREVIMEELPETEREIRNLIKNKDYIYEILHDVSESESSEKVSLKEGSCPCIPCLCSKDTDFLIEYQKVLDKKEEQQQNVSSVLDEILKKMYSDADARTRQMVSSILKDVFDEITGRDPKAIKPSRGVSFYGDIDQALKTIPHEPQVQTRTKPIKRCACGGEKDHPGPCECENLENVAKRKCDFKTFHDRCMHLSQEFLKKQRTVTEIIDGTVHKKHIRNPETVLQFQSQPKKEKPKNKIEMERRYIKTDISHHSYMVYTDGFRKTPPILWTLARRFLGKKQPEENTRHQAKRRRPNYSKKVAVTSSSATSSNRVFEAASLHSATSFSQKELTNYAPEYKKRKIEESVPKKLKRPYDAFKSKKALKQVPSIPVTILKSPPYGPSKSPEKNPVTILKGSSGKNVAAKPETNLSKNLTILVPPKQNIPKKSDWVDPTTSTPWGNARNVSKSISTGTAKSVPIIPSTRISDDALKTAFVNREKTIIQRKDDIVEKIPKNVQVIKDVTPPKQYKKLLFEEEAPVVKFPKSGHQKSSNANQETNLVGLKSGRQRANDSTSKTISVGTSGLTTYSKKSDCSQTVQKITPKYKAESLALKKRLDAIATIAENNKENKIIEIPSPVIYVTSSQKIKRRNLDIETNKDYSTKGKAEPKSSQMGEAPTNISSSHLIIKGRKKKKKPKNTGPDTEIGSHTKLKVKNLVIKTHSKSGYKCRPVHTEQRQSIGAAGLEFCFKNLACTNKFRKNSDTGNESRALLNKKDVKDANTNTESSSKTNANNDLKPKDSNEINQNKLKLNTEKDVCCGCLRCKHKDRSSKSKSKSKNSADSKFHRKHRGPHFPRKNVQHVHVMSEANDSRSDKMFTINRNELQLAIHKTRTADTKKAEDYALRLQSKINILKQVTPEVTKYPKSTKNPQKSNKAKYYVADKQVNALQLEEPTSLPKSEVNTSIESELEARKNANVESKESLSIDEDEGRPGLEDFGNFSISAVESRTKAEQGTSRNNSLSIERETVISRKNSLPLDIASLLGEASKSISGKNQGSKVTERTVDLENTFEKEMILAMSQIWKKAITSKSQLSTASKAALIDEMALIFDQLKGKTSQNLDSENSTGIQQKEIKRSSSKKHARSNKKSVENQLEKLPEEIPPLENENCAVSEQLEAPVVPPPVFSDLNNSNTNSMSKEYKTKRAMKKHKAEGTDKKKFNSINESYLDKHVGLLLHEIKRKPSNYSLKMDEPSKHSLKEKEQICKIAKKPAEPNKSKSEKNVCSVFTMFPSKTVCNANADNLSCFEDLPLTNKLAKDTYGIVLESSDVKIMGKFKVKKRVKKSQNTESRSSSKATTKITSFDSLHKAIKNDLEAHHATNSELLKNEKSKTKKNKQILVNVSSENEVQSFSFDRSRIEINSKNITNTYSPQNYTLAHVVTSKIINTKTHESKKPTSSNSDTSELSIVTLFKDMFRSGKSKKSDETSSVTIELNDDLFVQNFANRRLSTIVEHTEQTHTHTTRRRNELRRKVFCVPRNKVRSEDKIVYVVPRDNRPNVLSKLGGTVTKFLTLSSSKLFNKKPVKSSKPAEILEEAKTPLLDKRSQRTINSDIPSLVSYEALYENIMSLKSESAREKEKRRQLERSTEELERNIKMSEQRFKANSEIDKRIDAMKDSFNELLQNVQENIWCKLQEEKPFNGFVNCCIPSYENVSRRLELPKLEISLEQFRETLKKERSNQSQSMRDTCGICYKGGNQVSQKKHLIDEDDTSSNITIPSQEEFTGGDCDLSSLLGDSYELPSYSCAEKEYVLDEDCQASNLEFGSILISKPTIVNLEPKESSEFVKYYIIPQ